MNISVEVDQTENNEGEINGFLIRLDLHLLNEGMPDWLAELLYYAASQTLDKRNREYQEEIRNKS